MNMIAPGGKHRRIPNYDISGLSVLIVEKQSLMRTLMKQVFKEFRVNRLQMTDDIYHAVEIFQQTPIDLILSDWSHGLDGIEFLKQIRSSDSPNPYVPVIVVTAHTEAHHVFQARDAGMTEYLAKPISAQLIYQRICTTIDNTRPFIRIPSFFGPDRRRRQRDFSGPDRRQDISDRELSQQLRL